ncbi:uncharacterized protein [Vulpes vulpes]|uniref:Uncharacterized protein n=1 Tax=Vulpes vulpes TaxID=9627 RepID=A0ABM5AW95_VULVU
MVMKTLSIEIKNQTKGGDKKERRHKLPISEEGPSLLMPLDEPNPTSFHKTNMTGREQDLFVAREKLLCGSRLLECWKKLAEKKLKEFIASGPVLQEMLKEVLQREGKLHRPETDLHKPASWEIKMNDFEEKDVDEFNSNGFKCPTCFAVMERKCDNELKWCTADKMKCVQFSGIINTDLISHTECLTSVEPALRPRDKCHLVTVMISWSLDQALHRDSCSASAEQECCPSLLH